MLEIPRLRNLLVSLKKTTIDDVADRISYFWTSNICLFFALLTVSRMTFGRLIECRVDAEFPGSWVDYVEGFCFITGTYRMKVGADWDEERKKAIYYSIYPWIPVILVFQAVSIYLPHFIWKIFQKYGTIDFEYVVNECKKLRYSVAGDRDKGIVDIVDYLKMHLSYQKTRNQNNIGFGSLNSWLYFCSKGLSVAMITANIMFMNHVFGLGRNSFWGLTMIYKTLTNPYWEESGGFPRKTFCDYQRLSLLSPGVNNTVECVLTMNIMYEKMFVFLWVWFFIILIISIANFLQFAGIFLPFCRRRKADYYLRPHKSCNGSDSSTGYEHFESTSYDIFADATLGPDGLQLLDFIKEHAGGMVASQIACALLDNLKMRAPSSAVSHDFGSLPRNNVYIINEKDFIGKTGKSL